MREVRAALFVFDMLALDRPMALPPALLTPTPVVAIEGLPALPQMRVYPVALHLADKVAAMYELHGPDGSTASTRPHDLADIIILSRSTSVDAGALRTAIADQDQRRGITVPAPLIIPNPGWAQTYSERVRHTTLPTPLRDLTTALATANEFLEPVLTGAATGRWDPVAHTWDTATPSVGGLIKATQVERTRQKPATPAPTSELPPPTHSVERHHGYEL